MADLVHESGEKPESVIDHRSTEGGPHTPGPWFVETVKTSIGHAHKIAPIGACLYVDHRDATMTDGKTVKALANARLITAAPDMLEALKDATTRCYDCGGSGTMYPHDPGDVPGSAGIDCPNCAQQRAAIAKAEGRS